MDTAKDRIQFAIRFAQIELDRLRKGDWLNLKEELEEFIHPSGSVLVSELRGIRAVVTGRRSMDDLSADECKAMQRETRRILDDWMYAQSNPEGGAEAPSVKIEGDGMRLSFMSYMPGNRTLLVAGPPSPQLVGMVLNFLLWNEPADRILRCPECQTIFYRNRKQQYCSRPCTNRANMKNWRAKQ